MHNLQPKQIKLKPEEVKALITKYNISVSQLPKVKAIDPGAPENCERGDVLKIDRKIGDKIKAYYRVVV